MNICKWCGREFSYNGTEGEGHLFCSNKCYADFVDKDPSKSGKNGVRKLLIGCWIIVALITLTLFLLVWFTDTVSFWQALICVVILWGVLGLWANEADKQ